MKLVRAALASLTLFSALVGPYAAAEAAASCFMCCKIVITCDPTL